MLQSVNSRQECSVCHKSLNTALYALQGAKLYKTCPNCSKADGRHMYFPCPAGLGLTEKRGGQHVPCGVQSHCTLCRGGNGSVQAKGPCTNHPTGELLPVESVCLLPMSDHRLPQGEYAVHFLTDTLFQRAGKYYFGDKHVRNAKDCLFLFQYHGHIIGHGLCVEIHTYERPDADGNHGDYLINPETIVVYPQPFDIEAFKMVFSGITCFNQASQKVSLGALPKLFDELRLQFEHRNETIIQEVCAESAEGYTENDTPSVFPMSEIREGRVQETSTSRYERNPKARKACLAHFKRCHGGRIFCAVCGFDFEKVYGADFRNYIHVHHLNPISSFEAEHTIHPETDLIPICPNCHAVAHAIKPPYTLEQIQTMLKQGK